MQIIDRFSPRVLTFLSRITSLVNKVNQKVFVFLLLSSHYLTIKLLDNEEQYLQLARQFIDPNWIKSSFTLTEFPGTRLIYQYIAGGMLEVFSFEVTTLLGRFFLCLAFAFALERLYKYFDFANIDILLHLPILYFAHQAYFANEWIFLSFETKSFAYLFIFLAIPLVFELEATKVIILAIAATYFHVLVGGWFFAYFVVYLAVMGESRKAIKGTLLYSAAVLPFVVYLAQEIILRPGYPDTTINPDWVYTYFRNPHHTAIFRSIGYFISNHAVGVLFTFVALVMGSAFHSLHHGERFKRVSVFAIICFSGLLCFVVVAFFDRGGGFVKYYPFRIAAIASFLFALLMIGLMKDLFRGPYEDLYRIAVLLLSIFFLFHPIGENLRGTISVLKEKEGAFWSTAIFIRENVPESETILYIPDSDFDGERDFIRKTQRERFVIEKFVPSGTEKLVEWYRRILEKQKAISEPEYIPTLMKKRGIHYFLSSSPKDSLGMVRIYQNGSYFLYKKE